MSKITSCSRSCRSFFYFLSERSPLNFENLNLLRVLYSFTKYVKFEKIVDIVHLRFLRGENDIELSKARGFLKSRRRKNIELSKSWNLQTLDCGRVSYRSDDGGNYSGFPQLHCIHCVYFCGNPPNFVHKLSRIRADDCSKEYITNIPYLKKVHIEGKSRDIYACITNLTCLEQLEGLHIKGDRTQIPSNDHIVLLKNLRKLSLHDMRFEWEEINNLSKLPWLEVLKLYWTTCIDEEWEIQEEVIFRQLIALHISHSNIKHWKVSGYNFPKLEHLFLCDCDLREIPTDFAEILTLKSIKLWACFSSAVKSAKKIQDEQRDYGNYNMVTIAELTEEDLEYEKSQSEEELEVDN